MRPHSNLFTHHPLVHLAVAFSAGICIAPDYSFGAGIVCAALAVTLFIKQRLKLASVALLSAMFFTGAVLANIERRADESRPLKILVEQSDGEPLTLTGWLDAPPEFARDRVHLSLRVENISGRVSLLCRCAIPQQKAPSDL